MGQVNTVQIVSEPAPAQAPEKAPAGNGQDNRPGWLPEKFKSPEELAKAYAELEQKLGQRQAPAEGDQGGQPEHQGQDAEQQMQQATEALKVAGLDITPFSEEFARDGKLSDDSYAKLAEAGFSREVVDTFIRGVQAEQNSVQEMAEKDVAEIKALAGGEDAYLQMIQWAATALSPEEIQAFDSLTETGNKDVIKMAVAGLVARWQAAEGKEPELILDGRKPGQDVFRSVAEVTAAMRDPRYKTDEAYRNDVIAKLGRSKVF